MSIAFREAPFKTSIGTSARSLDSWFGDVINVMEFDGIDNTGTTYCHEAIQAAFDVAFGPSSAPHGFDNRHLNRPVFFPAGIYKTNAPLILTRVCGGHIYGAGKNSTRIQYNPSVAPPGGATLTPVIDINGASALRVERLYIRNHGNGGSMVGTNTCVINLDWDGDTDLGGNGGDGLHGNHFQELQLGGGNVCVIIGDSDNEGYDNLFMNCDAIGNFGPGNAGDYGYDIRGSASLNNTIIGGSGAAAIAWCRCPSGGGSVSVHGAGMASPGPSDAGFVMESGHTMLLSGIRAEQERILRMENGIVTMQSVVGTSGTEQFAEVNGGICIIQGCLLGGTVAEISGTGGELYVSGTWVNPSSTPLVNYSGVIKWDPGDLESMV